MGFLTGFCRADQLNEPCAGFRFGIDKTKGSASLHLAIACEPIKLVSSTQSYPAFSPALAQV